eukprot:49712_1
MRWTWMLLPILAFVGFAFSSSDVPIHSTSGSGEGLTETVHPISAPSGGDGDTPQRGEKDPKAASSSRLSVFSGLGLGRLTGQLMGRRTENNSKLPLVHSQNVHLPKVSVEEAPLEGVEEEERLERQRRGRWTFVDEADPVVSAIRSIRDIFPNVRFKCEPDTTLKFRKTIYPLKTMLTLGADYNTQIGVWQFRSTWEDPLLKGRISIAGRELMLSKSWLIKLMDNDDLATRLKLRVSIDTQDWNAKARFGFRTERLMPLNVRQGFSLLRRVPLDGPQGHAKMEVVTSFALPEPEIELSTRTIGGEGASESGLHGPFNLGTRGVIAGMGDVHIGIDELNLLLEY